ncbi:metallophosphoesterase [Candidatus Soleaferrea massiliensis]|uniref:metallophosphoesterase n=1 Tax=Candidatus Soleaferrea massiliensis TaxID=1470354 RepID=UPI00058B4D6D|nr:metallophosphoesterase [Candidatus Soleaferrea massiliensis]
MKIIKRIGILLGFLILCALLALGYAFLIEPALTVTSIHSFGQDGSDAHLRVVQLTDIQVSESYSEDRLAKLAEKVNALSPDVIVFTGDLFDNYAQYHPTEAVTAALSAFRAQYGKYAVWGNRDYGGGAQRIYEQVLFDADFTLLENDSVSIPLSDGTLLIGGLDDALLGAPDIPAVSASMQQTADYRILLLHEPDIADDLPSGTADLLLAGHSHGGQVRIPPFFDGIKNTLAGTYTRGFYEVNGMRLYVSSGLGTSHIPVRFLVPPEIAVFDISF